MYTRTHARTHARTRAHARVQVFKPRALYAHPPAFDGKRLMFREHSFLDNKRTPGGWGFFAAFMDIRVFAMFLLASCLLCYACLCKEAGAEGPGSGG